MKKTVKRVVSLALASVLAFSLAGCKDSKKEENTTTKKASDSTNTKVTYEKPTSIKVMWDGTILKEGEEDTAALYKAYEDAYGFKIEWVRPDHSKYAEYVSQAFASGDIPDVLILSAGNYVTYAAKGALYDFKNDWENSEIRDDNRFTPSTLDTIKAFYYVEGKNGELGLYGLPTTRGNGCLTYVRKSYLTKAGISADSIKTFDDYYNMLVAIKDKCGLEYVVTSAGYISAEAPYVNYLPEFFQDAYPDFYKNAEGKWVDGFQEPAMKSALERLSKAYSAQLLDPAMSTNGTGQARNNFIDGKCAVFSYWAGTWQNTLTVNIGNKFSEFAPDADGYGDVVALAPIKEVGAYYDRMAPVCCITKDANNAAGIYKYFVEPIFDGGDVMSVWMYGAKGAQWDDKAETITLKGVDYTYTEGQFHWKLNQKGDKFLAKNNIDPLLALCDYKEGKNPAGTTKNACISKLALDSQQLFNDNCKPAPGIKSNSVMSAVAGEIEAARVKAATQIIQGEDSYDNIIAEYKKAYGAKIEACLDSLSEE